MSIKIEITETDGGGASAGAQVVPPPSGDAATDFTNIQTAFNIAAAKNAATVLFSPFNSILAEPNVYQINATLRFYSNTTWDLNGGTLKLEDGANCDMIVTDGFEELTGTIAGTADAGAQGFKIVNGFIDGNGANQTAGTSVQLKIFGCNYQLRSLDILNGYTGGVWTEWASGHDPDYMEAVWTDVRVADYWGPKSGVGYGVYCSGPHDMQWQNVKVSSLVSARGNAVEDATIYGVYTTGAMTGLQATNLHVWGRHHYGIYNGNSGNMFGNCETEGAFIANLVMAAGTIWTGGSTYGVNGNNGTQNAEVGVQFGVQAGGASSVQQITISGATSGNFSLVYKGQTSRSISYPPIAADIQTALEGLTNIGAGNVTVTGSGPFTVTFTGAKASQQVLQMSSTSSLVGTSPKVTVQQVVAGENPATPISCFGAAYYGSIFQFNTLGYAVNWANSNGGNVVRALLRTPTQSMQKGTTNKGDLIELIPWSAPQQGIYQSPAPVGADAAASAQVFTTPGTTNWIKASGVTGVSVVAIACGAGAQAGGLQAPGTPSVGGNGGGAAAMSFGTFPAAALPSSVPVVVGTPGVGGPANTTPSTPGLPGTSGGSCTFGSFLIAGGGTTGRPGSAGQGGLGSTPGGSSVLASSAGLAGINVVPAGLVGAGGPGGGITSTGSLSTGGKGGPGQAGQAAAGAGGAANGGSGGNGNSGNPGIANGGGGGGGGGSSPTAGGNGGAGGSYGAGGGGGGAALNGGTSGFGGPGGPGIVIVTCW